MVQSVIEKLQKADPEIGNAVAAELQREKRGLELIASENMISEAVMLAMATPPANKYAEGYPGRRYYGGCECVDVIETIAIQRACKLFGANFANVQPHSGAQANTAVYMALLSHGDTVMGMNLAHGGPLTHGSPVNFSGINYNFVPSAYARTIDFERISKIAKNVGAMFMVDMAHIAGLVAAGLHPSPIPYADVVTTTTHKTLRGPRGGLILCNDEEIAKKINKAVFPGMQGGPLEHIIASKAVCFGEALDPSFKEYQKKIVENAKALAEGLLAESFDLVSGGTDNHLMLVDLRPMQITGKEMEQRLDQVYITVNKNSIPNDPEKPFVTSGIRVGTPAVTTRGLGVSEMKTLANLMALAATEFDAKADYIRDAVTQICKQYPIYE